MITDLISGVLAEVRYRKMRINEGGITELSSSRPCGFKGGGFFYIRRNYVLVYKNPPGEHIAVYNVDVADCDRRRRESNTFVKRNAIVLAMIEFCFGNETLLCEKGYVNKDKRGSSMDLSIELKNVTKQFQTPDGPLKAVHQLDLQVKRGEIWGIIGMSGAGKSTLIRCINFLERPTNGDVFIEGRRLGGLSEKELREARRDIGMIFQNFNLLMQRNVLDNVCLPLEIAGKTKKEAREKAFELLKIVGLEEKARAYPAQLSGGQKQRTAIARALAGNPKILLCDEATSALDPTTTTSILELLQKINRELGITIVLITHEMSVVQKICSHVATLENGMFVNTGSIEAVLKKNSMEVEAGGETLWK